jgi:hypothetical protein
VRSVVCYKPVKKENLCLQMVGVCCFAWRHWFQWRRFIRQQMRHLAFEVIMQQIIHFMRHYELSIFCDGVIRATSVVWYKSRYFFFLEIAYLQISHPTIVITPFGFLWFRCSLFITTEQRLLFMFQILNLMSRKYTY